MSVEATPVAPERFSIIDRASLGEIVVSLDPRLPDSSSPVRANISICLMLVSGPIRKGFGFNESELTILGARSFAAVTARAGLHEEENV